jgi:hypothetical protein
MTRHGADTVEAQFKERKKNLYGGECTCNKFVNCHDCRDTFSSQKSEREEILLSCIKSGNIIEARETLEHLFDRHNTCKSERTRCPLCREELRQTKVE